MPNLNKLVTVAKHDIALFNNDFDLAVYVSALLGRISEFDKDFAQELDATYSEIQASKGVK